MKIIGLEISCVRAYRMHVRGCSKKEIARVLGWTNLSAEKVTEYINLGSTLATLKEYQHVK